MIFQSTGLQGRVHWLWAAGGTLFSCKQSERRFWILDTWLYAQCGLSIITLCPRHDVVVD